MFFHFISMTNVRGHQPPEPKANGGSMGRFVSLFGMAFICSRVKSFVTLPFKSAGVHFWEHRRINSLDAFWKGWPFRIRFVREDDKTIATVFCRELQAQLLIPFWHDK